VPTRRYDQYCPIAVALDVLGDRWTLLILRELTMGERRFTDLRVALPGIAPNLLSERLRALQDEGLVEQRELPPPAARSVYAATPAGREAVPVLRSLARFGAGRLGPPSEDRTLSPARAFYSLLVPYHVPEAAGQRFHVRLHIDDDVFDVVTDGNDLSTRRLEGEDPDLEIELTGDALIEARRGSPVSLPPGPDAERFARLFQLVQLA
jgi:DNA-binding HxlR family transcriptional regulator